MSLNQTTVDLLRVCHYSIDALRNAGLDEACTPIHEVMNKHLVAAFGWETTERAVEAGFPSGTDPMVTLSQYIDTVLPAFEETFNFEVTR